MCGIVILVGVRMGFVVGMMDFEIKGGLCVLQSAFSFFVSYGVINFGFLGR